LAGLERQQEILSVKKFGCGATLEIELPLSPNVILSGLQTTMGPCSSAGYIDPSLCEG